MGKQIRNATTKYYFVCLHFLRETQTAQQYSTVEAGGRDFGPSRYRSCYLDCSSAAESRPHVSQMARTHRPLALRGGRCLRECMSHPARIARGRHRDILGQGAWLDQTLRATALLSACS